MNTTRWYIFAVAALIVFTYVSTQCRARYWPVPRHQGIVVDSWTGKAYQQILINDEGNEVDWPPNPWEHSEMTNEDMEAFMALPELEPDPRTVAPNTEVSPMDVMGEPPREIQPVTNQIPDRLEPCDGC